MLNFKEYAIQNYFENNQLIIMNCETQLLLGMHHLIILIKNFKIFNFDVFEYDENKTINILHSMIKKCKNIRYTCFK